MNWLSEACERWADEPALAAEGRTWTYRALDAETRRRAAGFAGKRLVATRLPPSPEHALILLAGLRAGCAVAPLHPRWPDALAAECAAGLGAAEILTPDGVATLPGAGRPAPEGPCTALFTSGSSGSPACVVHGVSAHLAAAAASSSRLPLGPGDRWLVALPLAHVSGLAILFRCLTSGACAVFGDLPATHVSLVPVQLQRRRDQPPAGLRAALVGGAATPPELARAAARAGWPLHLTYGLTEMASQVCTTERLGESDPAGHVGKPLPGVLVRAAQGRILLKGPMLAVGLWDGGLRPLAGHDGWLETADLGAQGADGNWRILGRADRVIVSGGENIPLESVEAALLACQGVERAVAVGIPDATFGTRPVAFVRGRIPEDWADRLRASLPSYAMPLRVLPLPGDCAQGDAKPTRQELAALEALARAE